MLVLLLFLHAFLLLHSADVLCWKHDRASMLSKQAL